MSDEIAREQRSELAAEPVVTAEVVVTAEPAAEPVVTAEVVVTAEPAVTAEPVADELKLAEPTVTPPTELPIGARLRKRLKVELACGVCGYDLRTLSTEGRCPECGTPVRDTLVGEATDRFGLTATVWWLALARLTAAVTSSLSLTGPACLLTLPLIHGWGVFSPKELTTLAIFCTAASGLALIASLVLVRRLRWQSGWLNSDFTSLDDPGGLAAIGLWAELAVSAGHVGVALLALTAIGTVGTGAVLVFCCVPMPTGVAAMVQLWSLQRLSVMGSELAAACGDLDASHRLDHVALTARVSAFLIVGGWVSVIYGWWLCPALLGAVLTLLGLWQSALLWRVSQRMLEPPPPPAPPPAAFANAINSEADISHLH